MDVMWSLKASSHRSPLCKRDNYVSAAKLSSRASVHGCQHALLGIMGQYDEALSGLQVPTFLLGLHRWAVRRNASFGCNAWFSRVHRASFPSGHPARLHGSIAL